MAYVFQGVEVYRHTSTLASQTRDWCNSNATLIYSGANELYQDTGLTAATHYYYAIFSKYYDSETERYAYSSGAVADAVTEEAPSLYQEWASYPNSPALTADYPYQMICDDTSGYTELIISNNPLVVDSTTAIKYTGNIKAYKYSSGTWSLTYEHTRTSYGLYGYIVTFRECNHDVYANTSLTTVAYEKTTP